MKRKEKESIKNMSLSELNSTLSDIERQLFELKFNKKISPIDNPLKIRILRRKIAFIKTLITEHNKKTTNITKE